MRKIGLLAVLHYVAYMVIGVCIIGALLGMDLYDNPGGIFVLLGIFLCAIGGAGLLLKLLQLLTRWAIFDALCMLIDLQCIALWVNIVVCIAKADLIEMMPTLVIIPAVAVVAALISFISNAAVFRK